MQRTATWPLAYIVLLFMVPVMAGQVGPWPAMEWSFDQDIFLQTKGVVGNALTVSPSAPITHAVPAPSEVRGALSFHYRLPTVPAGSKAILGKTRPVEILRLGELRLMYQLNRRLYWYVPEADARPKGSIYKLGVLSSERFVLIEIGWGPDHSPRVFVNGITVTAMPLAAASAAGEGTIDLTFTEGVFDEVRLEADPARSGARYRGVIVRFDFEAAELDSYFVFRNRSFWTKEQLEFVPGHDGSQYALATPTSAKSHTRLCMYLGAFRVTDDTYIAGAWWVNGGTLIRSINRQWPRSSESPHHRIRGSTPKDGWLVDRLSMATWKLKQGMLVEGIDLGSSGKVPRRIVVDNICLYRGVDETPPQRVTGVTAEPEGDGARIAWKPSSDDICVAGYVVYWSNVPQVRQKDSVVVGRTREHVLVHDRITHAGTHYYAVAAVDVSGNVGALSEAAGVKVE